MQRSDTSIISSRDRRPGVILYIVKPLLSDRWSTIDTYHLILAACILGSPRHVTMAVRNNGVGVPNVILGTGNDGVGVCDIVANGRNGWVCAYCEFLLEA